MDAIAPNRVANRVDGPPSRLKILMAAYACEPGKGSEAGVGWNMAMEMARHHDLWVLTHDAQREAIERALASLPPPHPRFVFIGFDGWRRCLQAAPWPMVPNYYAWQLIAFPVAKRLHEEIGFDAGHHVTYAKYSAPTVLAYLDLPYVWGPAGGAETVPAPFWEDFGPRARVYERLRVMAMRAGERLWLTRQAARRSEHAFATTEETASRLRAMGARTVEVRSESGLTREELDSFARLAPPQDGPVRLASCGRLLHWKGFHLGIRAFAAANVPDTEYWIIGDGPERERLQALAYRLGIGERVRFHGHHARADALDLLAQCHALVHPSLHDAGGWVCLEAMAAGRPVVCLDLGGPATQVTPDTGYLIPADRPGNAVEAMSHAFRQLLTDEALRRRMGEAGRQRVREHYDWSRKAAAFFGTYQAIARRPSAPDGRLGEPVAAR